MFFLIIFLFYIFCYPVALELQGSKVLLQLSPISCGWTEPSVEENMAVHPIWEKRKL